MLPLTLGHHIDDYELGGVGAVLIAGESEVAVEVAAVGARVIEGDVEDVNGAVLHVQCVLAAIPIQTIIETVVKDFGCHFRVIAVDL